MIVNCEKCDKQYDDFDHLTFCPHEFFRKLTFEEICTLNDKAEGLPSGTTEALITGIYNNAS